MTERDPSGGIPEARLEPRRLSERVVRAAANAKRGVWEAARLVGRALAPTLVLGVLFATAVVVMSWQRSPGDAEHERVGDRMRELVGETIEREKRAQREYAEELECRPPEYRPDARDAPTPP